MYVLQATLADFWSKSNWQKVVQMCIASMEALVAVQVKLSYLVLISMNR